jgi:hypothetical protein
MEKACQKTKWAVIFTEMLSAPLTFFYALLVPIFIKELHATPVQLMVLTTVHPVTTFIALYWSHFATKNPGQMLFFLKWGGIFSRVLWLFVPFINSPWPIIAIAGIYTLFSKGTTPVWSEVLRQKLEKKQRNHIFSIGAFWSYFIALILTLCINPYLSSIWKSAFVFSALIGLISIYFQMQVELPNFKGPQKQPFNFLDPPKMIGQILKKEPDFRKFQIRFMIFGIAMMLIHPVMMLYLTQNLKLGYVDIALVTAICKGFGSLLSSHFWGRLMNRFSMESISTFIFLLFGLFLVLVQFAHISIVWLYIAYFTKGIAQSAVHLLWHLSGPHYSKGKNSALYSSINLVMVGVRGVFAPSLGLYLAYLMGVPFVLYMACTMCLFSSILYTKPKQIEVA